jgi:hypothetical protein
VMASGSELIAYGYAVAAAARAAMAAQPQASAPASDTPLDFDALLSPEGAYEPGTGHEDDAQLVDQLVWWAPMHGCDTLDVLLRRIRARILPHLRQAPPAADAQQLQQLQQIADAASDYVLGKRLPVFAEEHGGLDLLEVRLAQLVARFEHGPRPVPGVDVPGPDGDYGSLLDLCAAEGIDPRIGAPLLKRAQEAWGKGAPDATALAEAREAARQLAGPAAEVVHRFLNSLPR